jgi:hypothetical protein
MARIDRPLRVIAVLALASCAVPPGPPDPSEPLVPDDLVAEPAEVTPENARALARRCLQQHRASRSDAHRRYGYLFRDRGFIQFEWTLDQGRERETRTSVDYALLERVEEAVRFDPTLLRHEVEVVLHGRFRLWEARWDPYRAWPAPDPEPETRPADRLVLRFRDAAAAGRLVRSLRLLSGKESR